MVLHWSFKRSLVPDNSNDFMYTCMQQAATVRAPIERFITKIGLGLVVVAETEDDSKPKQRMTLKLASTLFIFALELPEGSSLSFELLFFPLTLSSNSFTLCKFLVAFLFLLKKNCLAFSKKLLFSKLSLTLFCYRFPPSVYVVSLSP